jgi:hypothetical protein
VAVAVAVATPHFQLMGLWAAIVSFQLLIQHLLQVAVVVVLMVEAAVLQEAQEAMLPAVQRIQTAIPAPILVHTAARVAVLRVAEVQEEQALPRQTLMEMLAPRQEVVAPAAEEEHLPTAPAEAPVRMLLKRTRAQNSITSSRPAQQV